MYKTWACDSWDCQELVHVDNTLDGSIDFILSNYGRIIGFSDFARYLTGKNIYLIETTKGPSLIEVRF